MIVSVPIPAITDGIGEILHARMYYRNDGDGSLWLNNVIDVAQMNKASIANARRAAEWLAGKTFQQDVAIEVQPVRQSIMGRSWELMLALGMCSLLTGISPKPGITGTGKIGQDGMILKVSSYLEKIWASVKAGHTKFLLPGSALTEVKRFSQFAIIPIANIHDAWKTIASWRLKVRG